MVRKLITLLFIVILVNGTGIVHAQDNQPSGPVYIVQSGDNLTSIATQFGITQDELIAANAITDPNLLAVGDQLIIPGLEGITGVLMTRKVSFGSTLNSLAVENSVDRKLLTKLNHITSPIELYTGVSLIIPEKDQEPAVKNKYLLSQGQSILEFSILTNQNPWDVIFQNQIEKPALIPNGQVLYTSGGENLDGRGLQTLPLGNVEISPLPMVQGKTIIFKVAASEGTQLSGMLTDHPLHFFPDGNGTFIALQGIHAMQEPGVYPLQISMTTQDGSQYSQEQMVIIQDGNYGKDPVLMVKDEFIDPATTQPELDWLLTQVAPASPEKLWAGTFYSPSPYSFQDCLNSRYGNRRSYNGGPFNNFHSGVDFCGGEGVKIYSAADGIVVFSGPLTVRGNATIIDHGWGVYTGYWHQSQSLVKTGDKVVGGQVIGLVGATGRVTGAHLHWEVWVGGVQVSPLDWLTGSYP
jgi:murein DD-endopeptidase MepM/ murein hydrolase activator NlpD